MQRYIIRIIRDDMILPNYARQVGDCGKYVSVTVDRAQAETYSAAQAEDVERKLRYALGRLLTSVERIPA